MDLLESQLILQALDEDAGRGDVTTAATVNKNISGSAYFLAKADGILSGIDIACEVFSLHALKSRRDPTVRFEKKIDDGKKIIRGDRLAEIHAPLDIIL